MATTTTYPGLVNIDPIQGLEDYVNDIKPYHTKIFDLLVEYIYTDFVNVGILDESLLDITSSEVDGLAATSNENGGFVPLTAPANPYQVPTTFSEMFDFFITAPTPTTLTLASTDTTSAMVYFTGNVTADFQLNDLIVITGSTSNDGKYQLLSVGYDSTTGNTGVSLNTLAGSNGTAGTVTIYHADTVYSFILPIVSADVGPVTVTEPLTGTSFTVSTFTVQGNATRAIQAGSLFYAIAASGDTPTLLYHTAFVQFVPAFNTDGSRNTAGDATVIGVQLDTVFTDAVIGVGYLIPYSSVGYDSRYDAPYDQMAGYLGISE